MSDDAARNSAAFLDAIRAVVLTLETEYEGQSVVVRYRPAIAVKAAPKFPADDGGEDLVVMELLTTVADLVVSATIGGQPAAMGRSAMKLRTLTVLVGLFPAIG